jgi:hypothetical protein
MINQGIPGTPLKSLTVIFVGDMEFRKRPDFESTRKVGFGLTPRMGYRYHSRLPLCGGKFAQVLFGLGNFSFCSALSWRVPTETKA